MSVREIFTDNQYDLTFKTLTLKNDLVVEGDMAIDGAFVIDTLELTSTVNSTSTTTGAFLISGGMAVAQNLYVGGTLTATDIQYISTETVTSTADSTSVTTGAMTIAGGIGIGKRVNVGGSINTYSTSDSTSASTGSIVVDGGVGVAKNLHIGGDLDVSGSITGNFTLSTTDSTSSSTGALVIEGGLGVMKNVNFGSNLTTSSLNIIGGSPSTSSTTGDLIVNGGASIGSNLHVYGSFAADGVSSLKTTSNSSTTQSTSVTTGALTIAGGSGIAKNLYVGGDLNVSGSITGTLVFNTNESTSTSTGSLVVSGGFGVAKSAYIGGNIQSNELSLLSTKEATSTSTGSCTLLGGLGIAKKLYVGGECSMSSTLSVSSNTFLNSNLYVTGNINGTLVTTTTQSTSTSTGALTVSGGLGIAKDVYVGGSTNTKKINNSDTTESTSSTTGALMVSGGVGVSKNLYVGGSINATSNVYSKNNVVTKSPTGFPDNTASTITYNELTQSLTISPVSGTFEYWINGQIYSVASPQTLAHTNATGAYFFYFDTVGLKVANFSTFTNFEDKSLVALVYFYDTTYFLVEDERHTTKLDPVCHFILHKNIGCFITTDIELLTYDSQPSSPVTTSNQYSLSSGVLWDEDIKYEYAGHARGTYYYNDFQNPVSSSFWTFPSSTQPYKFNASTKYIQYQHILANSWTWSDVPNNSYMNYYLIIAPIVNQAYAPQLSPGLIYYSTLQEAIDVAYTDDVQTVNIGYVPPEFIILWKITFKTSSSYTNDGKCRIEAVQKMNAGKINYYI